MDSTDVTSSAQSSQCIRTHESFCTQFCAQVNKYGTSECPQNNEKYVQQITKILSQLSEERRWVANFFFFSFFLIFNKCSERGWRKGKKKWEIQGNLSWIDVKRFLFQQNFANFVKQQCEKDGGELFSNFVKCWYTAIGHVSAETDHVLPMLLLLMEVMKIDNLGHEHIINLHGVLEGQVILFIHYYVMEQRYLFGVNTGIFDSIGLQIQ